MTARGAQDNSLKEKEQYLHLSAIYSTDRAVLKSIITGALKPTGRILKSENKTKVPQELATRVETKKESHLHSFKEVFRTINCEEKI